MKEKIKNLNPVLFNSYCIFAAFMTYACMYAFRKPFSVGTFEGDWFGVDYKIVLIISQVLGYTLSKFIGIKVVSELPKSKRAFAILAMIGFAELALLGFALTPAPWNVGFLFVNGLPLGMIWGFVFSFLEGRKTTELLGAGLSASFIVSSGVVKSVGRWVMELGVSEFWMPFTTGLIFFPFLILFVYMLSLIPEPDQKDIEQRVERKPMDAQQRKSFYLGFAPGLTVLVGMYMVLTAYRDFRDNFAREIWDSLGFANMPAIFTASEIPIAAGVLIVFAFLIKIKDNSRAIGVMHFIMLAGSALIGLSTYAFDMEMIGAATWMVAAGFGLYLAYVPFGCMLFDRLIANIGLVATAGFMIYVADAFGYVGSVLLLLYKNFGHADLSWLEFFRRFSYVTCLICFSSLAYSWFYFGKSHKKPSLQMRTEFQLN